MEGDPTATPGATSGDEDPAPLEPYEGWIPGRVAGAHERIRAALGTGLSRAWRIRAVVAFVWAADTGLLLLALGAVSARLGGAGEPGVGVGEPVAELLVRWGVSDPSRPLTSVAAGLGPGAVAAGILWVVLSYVVAGGVLTLLHAGGRGPLLRRFLSACRVYLPRFLRLLALAAPAYAAVLWLDDRASRLLAGAGTPAWLDLVRGALAVGALACVGLLFDLAQVRAVLTGSRRMLRNLGRTIRFLARNFSRLALLYGVVGLAPGVLLATTRLLARPMLGVPGPAAATVVVVALGALGYLGVRVVLWGAELSLYRGLRTRELARRTSSPDSGLVK